jgi:predicted PurR-regulated permease PerM
MATGQNHGSPTSPAPAGHSVPLLVIAFAAAVAILWFGRAVFEPLAFAIFIIVLTAPFMRRLQPTIGKGLALILTVLLTLAVLLAFFGILGWGISRVAQWTVANLGRFEAVWRELDAMLAASHMPLATMMLDRFDPRWILGPVATLLEQFRLVSGFALLVFVFVVLGLTELEGMGRRLKRIEAERPSLRISEVISDITNKFGLYMRVRLVMSLIDGALCYLFFRLIGLEEPLALAILTATLNFIPFIGPLIFAVIIGFFAAAQFGTIWMVLLAVGGSTAINFTLGSYIEPLMAGSALSMSAVVVLFSVFFWAIIWGIPGAFIGVQIMIVVLAVLRVMPSASWIPELFSGAGAEKRQG